MRFASTTVAGTAATVAAAAAGTPPELSEDSVVCAVEVLPLESSDARDDRCAGGG